MDADALRPHTRSYLQAICNLCTLRAGNKAPPPIQRTDADADADADADERIIPHIGWNLQKFSDYYHYSRIFYDTSMPCKPAHQPATCFGDDEPFSTEEVRAAIAGQLSQCSLLDQYRRGLGRPNVSCHVNYLRRRCDEAGESGQHLPFIHAYSVFTVCR